MPAESAINFFTKAKQFARDMVSSFTGEERTQQQQSISEDDQGYSADQKPEQNSDHLILSTSAVMASVVVGKTLYPPFKLLGALGVIYTGLPIFKKTSEELKDGRVTTYLSDTILMGGMLVTGHLLLAAAVGVIGSSSLKLLTKTEDRARKQLINVFGQQPRHVWIVHDGIEVHTPFEQIQIGDIVVVNAGEIIAVDGTVTSGLATVDQHVLTGEAQPVEKEPGDPVFAATAVLTGRLFILVKQTGQATVAAQIGKVLNNAKDYKETLQLQGEKIADDFNIPTLILSGITWPLLGVNKALTIIWAGLGYNMRFLGTFSVLNYLQIFSSQGVLIKDGRVLDLLSQVDTIIFDKTGTLTLEQPHVHRLYPFHGLSEEDLLIYAATAEYRQSHPIAKAILVAAQQRNLTLPAIEEAAYEVGYGIEVKVNDKIIRVGSARFITKAGILIPEEVVKTLQYQAEETGNSLVYVALADRLAGVIELEPTIRPEARAILQQLRKRHLETYIISGDHEPPTRRLAEELGIDNYFAETLPEDKTALVEKLRGQGKFICFVGDGINDSIALKTAQVSISLRGASTAATDTAQIILMDGTLNHLNNIFDIAHDFQKNMKINFISSVVPGAFCISGVYLLNFGMGAGVITYYIGMTAGLINTMLPLWKHQKTEINHD
ncbi:Heavy metal translocating P-type ATPase [Gammaproteobacteria bacterium]